MRNARSLAAVRDLEAVLILPEGPRIGRPQADARPRLELHREDILRIGPVLRVAVLLRRVEKIVIARHQRIVVDRAGLGQPVQVRKCQTVALPGVQTVGIERAVVVGIPGHRQVDLALQRRHGSRPGTPGLALRDVQTILRIGQVPQDLVVDLRVRPRPVLAGVEHVPAIGRHHGNPAEGPHQIEHVERPQELRLADVLRHPLIALDRRVDLPGHLQREIAPPDGPPVLLPELDDARIEGRFGKILDFQPVEVGREGVLVRKAVVRADVVDQVDHLPVEPVLHQGAVGPRDQHVDILDRRDVLLGHIGVRGVDVEELRAARCAQQRRRKQDRMYSLVHGGSC